MNILARSSPASPLVFLHIPKTGGTTLGEYLSRYFEPNQISPSFNDVTLMREVESGVHHSFYSGHFSWSSASETLRPATILTMLRHPIDRCVSQYKNFADKSRIQERWNVDEGGRELNDILMHTCPLSFHATLTHPSAILRGHFSNIQTRSLIPYEIGLSDLVPGFYCERAVQLAKYNLKNNVQWFGVLDFFEKTAHSLSLALNLPAINGWDRKNHSDSEVVISSNDTHLLNQMNLMDTELHQYALKLYGTRYSSVGSEEVDTRFARQCEIAAAQKCTILEGRSGHVSFNVNELAMPATCSHLEEDGLGTKFRWFSSSDFSFYLAGPGLPSTLILHVLTDVTDDRLSTISLVIESHEYDIIHIYPESKGAAVMFQPRSSVSKLGDSNQPWRTLRVSLRGRDTLIPTTDGLRKCLVAIHRIEASWTSGLEE